MDELATIFFSLAAGIAQDRVGLGAPAELVDAIGVNSTNDAVSVAALIVRAMLIQRAVDLRRLGIE